MSPRLKSMYDDKTGATADILTRHEDLIHAFFSPIAPGISATRPKFPWVLGAFAPRIVRQEDLKGDAVSVLWSQR